MTCTRPIWAEISRTRLAANFRTLRDAAGPDTELFAVIKANGYGHSLAICAEALAAQGARWFGVTGVEEGLQLRAISPQSRILAMSGLWPGEADALIESNLTPVVWQPDHLAMLAHAASRRNLAPGSLPVHLEIDTGMSRQGVHLAGLTALLDQLPPALRIEAVMTHFYAPDEPEPTAEQMRLFTLAVDALVARGMRPSILSAGSSADLLDHSTTAITSLARRVGATRMIRAGLGLYGYGPGAQPTTGLQTVLAWKTRITGIREIPAGATAGYSATFRAQRPTRLALLPLGYADGFSRLLSSRGSALVHGQRAPVAGRISMDQTLLDITGIPQAAPGDEVVLIGEQEGGSITAADIAALTGTIPYEVLCAISARVPRIPVE